MDPPTYPFEETSFMDGPYTQHFKNRISYKLKVHCDKFRILVFLYSFSLYQKLKSYISYMINLLLRIYFHLSTPWLCLILESTLLCFFFSEPLFLPLILFLIARKYFQCSITFSFLTLNSKRIKPV